MCAIVGRPCERIVGCGRVLAAFAVVLTDPQQHSRDIFIMSGLAKVLRVGNRSTEGILLLHVLAYPPPSPLTPRQAVATLLTYPLQVVKSRLQWEGGDKKATMLGLLKKIVDEEGAGHLYSGFYAKLAQTGTFSKIVFIILGLIISSSQYGIHVRCLRENRSSQ